MYLQYLYVLLLAAEAFLTYLIYEDGSIVSGDEIFFENKSKNTYENILFSQQILKTNKNKKWLLVTSAFHMKRAILIGEKIGWDFIVYPVDFKISKDFKFKPSIKLLSNINYFNSGSHEWLGLISYYLMGRTRIMMLSSSKNYRIKTI